MEKVMQIKPLSKIKEEIYGKMNFYYKRNISGVILNNCQVFVSIFTENIVNFSQILHPDF